jgi:hypothetical protein
MEHLANGKQKKNGTLKTGPRHGVTRDARNAVSRALGKTRKKKGHRGEDNAPKKEGESPCTKQY